MSRSSEAHAVRGEDLAVSGDDRPTPGALSSQRWQRLMPLAFITYSFAYLDRSNYSLGSAGGLKHALHISSGQAGLLGGLFFIGYFIFRRPSSPSAAASGG